MNAPYGTPDDPRYYAEETDPRFVYQFLDADGQHIYIGVAVNIAERLRKHLRASPWFSDAVRIVVDVYPDMATGEAAEKSLIQLHQPRANVVNTARQSAAAVRGWETRRANIAKSGAAA